MSRSAALVLFTIALVVILLPAAAVSLGRQVRGYDPEKPSEDRQEPVDEIGSSPQIRLYRSDKAEVISIELEEYLVGVVMAEMPASFELEALKAQAVIARTYTLRRVRYYGGGGCSQSTEAADICSDSTHCQAWREPAETAAKWWSPEEAELLLGKVRQAVRETAGEVVVYQGTLAEAVYHSTCGGQTEASHGIWSGGSVPYLQSISCPHCDHSPHFRKEVLITFEQFTAAMQQDLALPASTTEELPLRILDESPGGRVGLLQVNDVSFEGKEVRRLLDLPSTAFSWQLRQDGLLFMTSGYGHGVGLCQYGADGLAVQGKTYRQIVSYYYPGTVVTTFNF